MYVPVSMGGILYFKVKGVIGMDTSHLIEAEIHGISGAGMGGYIGLG
jgi:hypothetical protein